ncbi:MAG TPA: peptidoglycan-binding protein [Candidatus Peribacterales bacterium]|nr:peptidoglycan-binding protein [Candidatus Peribacterales bacterium]
MTQKYIPHFYPATIVLASLMLSIVSPVYAAETWVKEEHSAILTAYYSPEPNQEKYYLGSYAADTIFNGQGIQGADGTKVYPGMMAASDEIPFGARIEVPGLNIVGTVHDRGGRIETGNDGVIRVDVWMGKGKEGLARALQFGVQKHAVTVYVPKTMEVPEERLSLSTFPAPLSVLKTLPGESQALVRSENNAQYGDTSILVTSIQHALEKLGYFDHPITTYFGDVTKESLTTFLRDAGIEGSGDSGDQATRETLAAHIELTGTLESPELNDETLLEGNDGHAVRILQRLLKLLGYYNGDIDGEYDQELMSIVYKFQQEKNIVTSPADTGAGIVGPQTRRALITSWREYRITKRGGADDVVAMLFE